MADISGLHKKCLRPTPTDLLPVLAGIAPASLRREKATHDLSQ